MYMPKRASLVHRGQLDNMTIEYTVSPWFITLRTLARAMGLARVKIRGHTRTYVHILFYKEYACFTRSLLAPILLHCTCIYNSSKC